MARRRFRTPDVGEGTVEVEIVKWRVAAGEDVAADQPLVDLMTDKATVEIGAPFAGKVVALHGAEGERVAVGGTLAEFEVAEADGAKAPA
ncbi:MAG: 2-oxo acid dehydrogenase subunit E2, partial [Hyphomicrobiales bacterium]|nr:2-oxo acid dehydrogenase subunit E2 [Hyphomicrobiales bacterium]